MMKKLNLANNPVFEKVLVVLGWARRYSFIIFLIFIACVYGFIIMRINDLNNAQPSPDAVSSQVKADRIPRIDQNVVQQLQSLQDNSVNVQALFNQARNNPFQ
ncbi:MAG TPA: hypothetical protein VHB72_02465 [Candidatus Saccharimonadales bacterium]|nr:hypothetical protein [Candidatus Saccharimonadales bacterium]